MGKKACKKEKNLDEKQKKYRCKKCGCASNKESHLCKPQKRKD